MNDYGPIIVGNTTYEPAGNAIRLRAELANVDALLLDPYCLNEVHSDEGRQAKIRRLQARAAKSQSVAILRMSLAAVDVALGKALQTFDAGVGRLERIQQLAERANNAPPRTPVMVEIELDRIDHALHAAVGPAGNELTRVGRIKLLIDELELERGVLRTTAENRDLAREQVRQLWTALRDLLTYCSAHPVDRKTAQAVLESIQPVPADDPTPAPPAAPAFHIGQRVRKVTGDYNIAGEVRSVFATAAGAIRYVVEHQAEGGGSFLHVYGEANLVAEPAQ